MALVFSSCAAKRKTTLSDRVTAYHESCRWKDFTTASYYVENQEDFLDRVRKSNFIEISEFEIVRVRTNSDSTEATVQVRRIYTMTSSVTVQTQVIEQKWKYDRKKKDWFLVSPY